jgi:hypothetical protein
VYPRRRREQVCGTRAGWYGLGIAVGLVTTALVVWVTVALVGVELPRGPEAALAATVLVLVVVEFATHAERRQWAAWVGLALAIAVGTSGALSARESSR